MVVNVTKVNHAPTVCDVTCTTGVGQALCLNWKTWSDDVDGDTLKLAGISAAQHGNLEIHSDGSLWYIPKAGFSGSETLSIAISDGTATTTARVTVNVQNSLLGLLGLGQSIHEDDSGSTINVVSTLPTPVALPCAEDLLDALFGSSKAQAAGSANVKITLDAPVAPPQGQSSTTWAATFVCGTEQDKIVMLPNLAISLSNK